MTKFQQPLTNLLPLTYFYVLQVLLSLFLPIT